jgi:hypothetical protein
VAQHGRTAKKTDATKNPKKPITPLPNTPNRIIIKNIGKNQGHTTPKTIGIISGFTSGTNTTARASPNAIIGISLIADTFTNTAGIINRTIKFSGRLKNTTVQSIIARFTAARTVKYLSRRRHLTMAGQLKYHPGISELFSEGGAVELSGGILQYFAR